MKKHFIFSSLWLGVICIQASAQKAKPDTLRAHQLIEEAKKSFQNPGKADSLGMLAFHSSGGYLPYRADGAFIVSVANLDVNFERSLQWADTALYYFKKSSNNLWAGYVLRQVGVKAQSTNKNELAINSLLESSRYFEKAKDTLMTTQNYVNLSLLYHNNLMDFGKGLQYGLEALRLLESQHKKDPILQWRTINAIAISYDDSKEWDKALVYHERNLSFENPGYKNSTLNNIGNTLRKKGEFAKAKIYFEKSLALIEPTDYYDLATTYLNLAQVNADLNKINRAFFYNDSSIYYANKSKNIEKLRDSYQIAYELNQKEGNYEKAFGYLKHLMEIKDSVLNKDKALVIYEMETRFQSEKKERQIAQLQNETLTKDFALQRTRNMVWWIIAGVTFIGGLIFALLKRNQFNNRLLRVKEQEELQRQRFSAVIEAEENERSRVAKDLHDGLGQLLSSAKLNLTAIALPTQDVQLTLLNNSINALDQATQEVRSISQNLMPAALMELGLKEALEDMAGKINESKLLNIRLSVSGISSRLPPPIEVAVYRIVQEVINNMIKHSKADQIEINIASREDALHLVIADNGVGFEKELITKSKGLGWKSILSRIAMLKGNIEVDTQPGKGTQINIQFALA